jgi:alpha-glucosidase
MSARQYFPACGVVSLFLNFCRVRHAVSRHFPKLQPRLFQALAALAVLMHTPLTIAQAGPRPFSGSDVSILTQRYDSSRTGTNLREKVLNVENVSATAKSFGKLYSFAVDGNVYAQPLYVANLTVSANVSRNVLYVATQKNNIYALDADTGTQLWARSLGASMPATDFTTYARTSLHEPNSFDYKDVYPDVGVTSTPVIDLRSETIFVVAKTKEGTTAAPSYHYRLHALNLKTGRDQQKPIEISGGVAGTSADAQDGKVIFDPLLQLNRPGLLLAYGKIYVAFGSTGDAGPFHGWVFGFDALSIAHPPIILCTTPDQDGPPTITPPGTIARANHGGIWQSGNGLASDDEGSIYLSTGDGAWDGKRNFSDSYLRLDKDLNIKDWFTPWNHLTELDDQDVDLGSGGPVLLPGRLLVGGGKEGKLYVIRRDYLGHLSNSLDAESHSIVQEMQVTQLPPNPARACSNCFRHLHGSPVYWPTPDGLHMYVWPEMEKLKAFKMSNGLFVADGLSPESAPMQMSEDITSMPGGILVVSSDGGRIGSGIVWAALPKAQDANRRNVPGVLRAFDASDVSKEIWNSEMNPLDQLGNFAKFCPPVVANGKVYLATFAPEQGYPDQVVQTGPAQIVVYGILDKGVRKPVATYPTVVETRPSARTPRALTELVEQLDPGVMRFFGSQAEKAANQPSYALKIPIQGKVVDSANFRVKPVFLESAGAEIATVPIESGTSLYGTGMVAGPLLRNGQKVMTWNLDAYAYGLGSPNLYQSHPWVLAVRADGTAYGVLADTTYRCTIDTTISITFTCPPNFPLIIIDSLSPQGVIEELSKLTGYMPLPPKWALGFHQSKFSYTPASKVEEIAKTFRDKAIPCDSIWMDIDYMDHYRIFSFDPQAFPSPKQLNADLKQLGFHNVWMIDPAVKAEATPGITKIFDSGTADDVWIKQADNSPYKGNVWPGPALFPDFLDPAVRTWWGGFYKDFVAQGVTGVWNDMNEPAVFTQAPDTTKTMPETNLHRGDPTMVNADGKAQGQNGAASPHSRYHNVYGMMMARGTREGMLEAAPNSRPFVLSRANYVGGQRYAASWTGDNTASWQHLGFAIPMVLNLGLSGQPFSGPDIGGYRYDQQGQPKGSNPTQSQDGKLYARWMGIGTLLPFSRGHYEKGYPWDKEPWSFSDDVTTTSRLALQRRYRLMPYLYTLFEEASRTGLPIARPLFFADSKDPKLRSIDNEFLLGTDLLVVGQVQLDAVVPPILPLGIWQRVGFPQTDLAGAPEDDTNSDLPALYLRGGAIVPSGPIMQYVDQKPLNPLTLMICLDVQGHASGTIYQDSGDGFDNLAIDSNGGSGKGQFSRITFEAQRKGSYVAVRIIRREGRLRPKTSEFKVRLFTIGKEFDATGRGDTISLKVN